MLNFILNNFIFETIIEILILTNIILTTIIDNKQNKKTRIQFKNLNNTLKAKIIITLIILLLIVLLLYIKYNKLFSLIIYIILPAILLINTFFEIYTNQKELSINEKYKRIWASYIFIIFFSSKATPIYYTNLTYFNHTIKEILLIIFLLGKIILLVFFSLINFSILISNINILIPLKSLKELNKRKYYNIIDYNFILYNKHKSKIFFIIDSLIYLIFAIPTLIINTIIFLFLKFIKKTAQLFNFIIQKLIIFSNDSNNIIRKITNISIIIALSVVYIITIFYKRMFSNEVLDFYNYFSTVILIPLIYESIKSK